MKLRQIKIENYRQYADFVLDFMPDADQALLIVGHMGAGKTNLLNAINWCLYGKELFESDVQRSDPFVYKGPAGANLKPGEAAVTVSLGLILDGGAHVNVTRKQQFTINDYRSVRPSGRSELTVQLRDGQASWSTLTGNSAADWVERYLPERIRPYYLLNLERMQQFIHDTESNRVRQAILAIAQIDILASTKKRLESVRRDLYSSSGSGNDVLVDGLAREVSDLREQLDSIDAEIETSTQAIENLANQVARADADLESNREAQEVQVELAARREALLAARGQYDTASGQLREVIVESAAFVFGWRALQSTVDLIREEKEAHRYPAPIDPDYLRQLLSGADPECICGTALASGTPERLRVEAMLPENIGLAGIGEYLMRHESGTAVGLDRATNLERRTQSLRNQIAGLDEAIRGAEIAEAQQEAKLEALGGVNPEVSVKKTQRDKAAFALKETEKALVARKKDRERCAAQLEKTEKQYKIALRKDEHRQRSAQLLEFTERCLEAADLVYERLLADARARVSAALNASFMRMMVWKQETFSGATVDDEYRVAVRDVDAWESTGSLSGGENVCLAIAFGQALGEVSSFDIPPLIFDSPLVNLDATARVSVARTIADNLGKRQLILLMKPGEYDHSVVQALRDTHPKMRLIDLRFDQALQAAYIQES